MVTKEEYKNALTRMYNMCRLSDESEQIKGQFNEDVKLFYKLVNEHFEGKQETNLDHYKDGIIEVCADFLAISKGKVVECNATPCSECDFVDKNGQCIGCYEIINWFKQPYKKPVYKLSQFEYDLLQSYLKTQLNGNEFKSILTLNEMKGKGYFKGIDDNEIIEDILAKCEVEV